MTKIDNFQSFVGSTQTRRAAGIAIVWAGKILLVHPTNSSWQKRTIGIPKGGIDPGESEIDAAIRETFEETGIRVPKEMLDPAPETIDFFRGGKPNGNLTYYVCRIQAPSEIGLAGDRVPKEQLQLNEIDWAGFLSFDEAYAKISYAQLIILDRLKS